MMKQAQQLQKQMSEAQKVMSESEVSGCSGGGAVTIVLSGTHAMKKISIDAGILQDAEVLEDLIVAAHNDAYKKLEKKREEVFGGFKVPQGLDIPGL